MLMRIVNIFNIAVRKMVEKKKTVTEESKQAADNKEANKDIFYWSDDEIQLLLTAALNFKS